MIKFCKHDGGCHEVAIGVSRWHPDQKPVSNYCRPHYLSDVLTETVRCEVVGPCAVTDCRTQQGVGKGGTVELDPLETNVAQLVYAGHVKVIPAKPADKPQAKPSTAGSDAAKKD